MVRISVQLVGSARQELELLQGGCSVSLQHSASCIGWFRPVMLAACNACACYLSAAPAFDLGGGASATGWARLQSSPLRTETGAQGHGTARGWQGHHHSARWRLVGVRACLVAPHPQYWLAGIKMFNHGREMHGTAEVPALIAYCAWLLSLQTRCWPCPTEPRRLPT